MIVTPFELVLADPGLRGSSGHHAAAMDALLSAVGQANVYCYGCRGSDPDWLTSLRQRGVSWVSAFRTYFYEAYNRGWSVAEAQPYVSELADDYTQLIRSLPVSGRPSVVLHHTMDWPQLLALATALSSTEESKSGVEHLVFLMFEPGVAFDGKVTSARRYLNYRIALSMLGRQRGVRLFASCQDFLAVYRSAFESHLDVGLHPCFFFSTSGAAAHPSLVESDRPSSRTRVLLYVGDAKAEKGFCELPQLSRAVLGALGQDVEVIAHYVLCDALTSPALEHAAESLQCLAREDSRFQVVSGYLPAAELTGLMAGASFLVLNYNVSVYANKSSGMVWQACWHGVPLVFIGESWLSREARRINPAVRAFDGIPQLERELQKRGRVEFARHAVSVDYRQTLFASINDFIRGQFPEFGPLAASAGRLLSDGSRGRVLFVDAGLPDPTRNAGGHAALQEIGLFQSLGFAVSLAILDGALISTERLESFRQSGIDIGSTSGSPDVITVLRERGHEFAIVYVTRFTVGEVVTPMVRQFAPQAKVVLNVADLHFLREARRAEVLGRSPEGLDLGALRTREFAVAGAVDLVLSYSDVEIELIEREMQGSVPVRKCPWVDDIVADVVPFSARSDIAFLGGFSHEPNEDAILWFSKAVMPLLEAALPNVRLRVFGADVTPAVGACACDSVVIEGFVEDVSAVYDRCRVFVAPLRFGAGLKGKVVGALCHGVPTVLSPVAAEGVGSGETPVASVATTPSEWVRQILALYYDEAAWIQASRAALHYARANYTVERARAEIGSAVALLCTDRGDQLVGST